MGRYDDYRCVQDDDPQVLQDVRYDITSGLADDFEVNPDGFEVLVGPGWETLLGQGEVEAVVWRYRTTPTPLLSGELEVGEIEIHGATFVIDDDSTVLYRRFIDWYGALGEVGILGASRVVEADEIDDQDDLAAS
jgi:hypothetical protein